MSITRSIEVDTDTAAAGYAAAVRLVVARAAEARATAEHATQAVEGGYGTKRDAATAGAFAQGVEHALHALQPTGLQTELVVAAS